MSLTSSLFTGVSGLTNQGNAMQVIGDNIANVNTLGFKGNRFTFSDLLSQSISTQSGTGQVGRGVGLGSVDSIFQQGSLESTGNTTDLSIGGDGFFIVKKTGTDLDLYTRAGNFNFNKDGELTNELGYIVQGWKLDSETGLDVGSVSDIVLQGFTSPPEASTRASAITNLNSDTDSNTQVLANAWNGIAEEPDPFISNTAYEYQTVVKVYDSLGSTHDVTIYYDKKSGSDWEYIIAMNPEEDKRNLVQGTSGLGLLARGTIEFNESSGAIDNVTMDEFTGRVSKVAASGSITEEDTVFTVTNADALPVDGLDFSLEYDGTEWDFENKVPPPTITALDKPPTYRNAKIVSSDANGIMLNLDGDAEGTVDLEIKFKNPAQATDALTFDIMNPLNIHVQDVTDTDYRGEAANDNTQLFIDNPNVLDVDATGLNVIWDASAAEWYWSTPTLQNVTAIETQDLVVDLTAVPAPTGDIIVATPVPVTDPEVMKFYSKDVELHWDHDAGGVGVGEWSWRSPNARELSNQTVTGGIPEITEDSTEVDVNIADITQLTKHSTGNSLLWNDVIGVTGLEDPANFTGGITAANTVLTMPQEENLTFDSTPTGGYILNYDPTAAGTPADPFWTWAAGNDPVADYPNRQTPLTGDMNSVSLDLTGDGTDIKLDFPTALAAGGTIAFEVDSSGEWTWNMPVVDPIAYTSVQGVDLNAGNTEVNIINPAAVTRTSTLPYDLVYDPDGALGGAGPWKWNGNTPTSVGAHRPADPADPTSGPYQSDTILVNTANRVTIDLDNDGLADIEYNFQDTLATDTPPVPAAIWGGIQFGLSGSDSLRVNNTPPAEYAGAQILAGSNEDAISIDLTGNGTADITYSFTNALSEDGTIDFDIDTHIPPAEYQDAQILAANSDAGKINIDVDGDGISNMLFTFQDSAVTPVLQNLSANSTFVFDIDPRVPPTEYSNATISGDEKEVKLDMDNDSNDDIRFTFTTPLSTGPVAEDSEILFNIEGTTAWTAQTTNDDGYFEFTTDFLGGAGGATVQDIEFDVGTKDDGTGQFVNDSLSTTQFARPSSTVFQSADGFGAGDLEGVDVSSDGIITGIYSNGELIPLYRVALAKFQNNQGLFKEGNNMFRETRDSGTAITNRPGENGLGSISPNSLEMSNVDVANEFVKMITTQRGYQANSKIITTVDSMLGDAIQMKR